MVMDYLKAYEDIHEQFWLHTEGRNLISTYEAKIVLAKYFHFRKFRRIDILKEMQDMGMLRFESRDMIQLLRRPKEMQQELVTA